MNWGGVFNSIIEFITGHSWTHMWYLYMLIGLYLMTPIIKPFVVKASDRELLYGMGILFVLSSLLPTMNMMGISLSGYMIISTPYIFMYVLGYYLCWRFPDRLFNRVWLIAILLLCSVIMLIRAILGCALYGYIDPTIICTGAVLFLIVRMWNINSKLANRLTPYCFGVYLLHPVFINFMYKVMGMDKYIISPVGGLFAAFILFTILSLLGTYILMKIPFMKKHVL